MSSDGTDESVVVRIVKQAAPPSFVSEANSLEAVGIPATEWHAFLRKEKIGYTKHRALHIAAFEDVSRALREGAERRPGPRKGTTPKKPLPSKDATPSELLERAGFRRSGAA
ncbi:MAG TPA: hypothetical protein VK540_15870 [Polyangiaceae bacterium]|nr:hypothetical protein [Polyangiaceae bacterium]